MNSGTSTVTFIAALVLVAGVANAQTDEKGGPPKSAPAADSARASADRADAVSHADRSERKVEQSAKAAASSQVVTVQDYCARMAVNRKLTGDLLRGFIEGCSAALRGEQK
jgi:hypothetical protein